MLVQQEITHIVKHEDWKAWCPFGFFDIDHACYMYPVPAIEPEDRAIEDYDPRKHDHAISRTNEDIVQDAERGHMPYCSGKTCSKAGRKPIIPREDGKIKHDRLKNCFYADFMRNIEMPQTGNHMSYHSFRFSKHTVCRIAWRVLATFPEYGYYDGTNKARHLSVSDESKSYAKGQCITLIIYACWYEFGHTDPMTGDIAQPFSEAWKEAGKKPHTGRTSVQVIKIVGKSRTRTFGPTGQDSSMVWHWVGMNSLLQCIRGLDRL
jgi:hypothetical protein